MKKKTLVLLLTLVLTFLLAFTACGSTVEVTFQTDAPCTVQVKKGEKLTEIVPATATGVYVEGWYTEEELLNKWNFADSVERDMTLYPKYETKLFAVDYNLGGKPGTAPSQTGVNADASFSLAQPPLVVGYRFTGWSDGSAIYQAGENYVVTGKADIVLTATWETAEVTVTFENDKGEHLGEKTVPYGSDVIAPAVSMQYFCYDIGDWDKSLEAVTEDMTVVAVYTYVPTDNSLFTFALNEDGKSYSVAGVRGADYPDKVAIPREYKGLPVTYIGFKAFYTMFNASGSTELFIPGTVKEIASEAFYRCMTLQKIYIEEGVKKIGVWSFQCCWELAELEVPDSLTDFGINAFDDTTMLNTITVTGDGQNIVYNEEKNWVESADGSVVYLAPRDISGELEFDSTVKVIWHGAFSMCYNITSVVFEADVEEIGCEAFSYCSGLSSVTFLGNVTRILGADSSKEAEIAEKYDYEDYEDVDLNRGAFFRCAISQQKLTLNGTEYIGGDAFSGANIRELELDPKVKYIGEFAFLNDSANNNPDYAENGVITPAGFKSIRFLNGAELSANGKYLLTGDALIEKGAGEDGGDLLVVYAPLSENISYTVPASVTSIEFYAFTSCTNLTSVILPEGMKTLGGGSFMECFSLESVTIPSSLTRLDGQPSQKGTVLSIGAYPGCFLGCVNLSEVVYSGTPSLEYIDYNVFASTALTTAFIPASVETIMGLPFLSDKLTEYDVDENNAYFTTRDGVLFNKDMTRLIHYPAAKAGATYNVPSSVVNIGEKAFVTAVKLTEITVAEGTLEIEGNAFAFMYFVEYQNGLPVAATEKGIERIVLPATLEKLGAAVFKGSNLLESVEFKSGVPSLPSFDEGMFLSNREKLLNNLAITVPENLSKQYYVAFSNFNELYSALFDESAIPKTSYVFDVKGGDAMESASAIQLFDMPIPSKDGAFFQGWYLSDGTVSGEWGERVSFPYCYFGEDTSVTLYARWDNERLQNGENGLWAYDISFGLKTVNPGAGETVWFVFTAKYTGTLDMDYAGENQSWSTYLLDDWKFTGEEMWDHILPLPWQVEAGKTYYLNAFFDEAGEASLGLKYTKIIL